MSKQYESCGKLIEPILKELDKLEEYSQDVSELRRLHASLILGLCKDDKLVNTKEDFLQGFNSYDSPFPRWFKRTKQ
jgi:hypothetical protein